MTTILGMPKPTTTTVRVPNDTAEKLQLVASYLTDMERQDNPDAVSISAGDLIERWCDPHLEEHLADAVSHDAQKKKRLLSKRREAK